jgi:hypothetical protein
MDRSKPSVDVALELALALGSDNGQRLREVLAAKAVKKAFDRMCAVRSARRLLHDHRRGILKAADAERFSAYGIRAEIRDRLMAAYGMRRASAYRGIDEALQTTVSASETSWPNNGDTSRPGDVE